MSINQNDTLRLAQEFLRRMGSDAEPSEIAKLFSETLEWDIAGDTGALPWIGHKSGRAAITDFVRDSRAMIERISFEVHDILASDKRAVILGSLASKLNQSGKIVTTDFAIILTASNGEIVRFQMLEDSFAVSQAARN
jgi:ketosteroid isomerase-like protein